MTRDFVAGVFIGGASRRMGGAPKGLLRGPGGVSLVERWIALFRGLSAQSVLLVGQHDAYAPLGLAMLADGVEGIGPLGGLIGLLEHCGKAWTLAVACDMPFVSAGLVRQLLDAPDAAIVAPRRGARWEPFCARYDPLRVGPIARRRAAAGQHSLQGLLEEIGASELALTEHAQRELADWDTPEDRRSLGESDEVHGTK